MSAMTIEEDQAMEDVRRRTTMRAMVHERYGRPGPGVLRLGEVDVPVPAEDEVLVRVHASSINPVEWYGVTGPLFARFGAGWHRPKDPRLGADLAGVVEAVGRQAEGFETGDEVFGCGAGAWAQYAVARPGRLAHKPASVSFADAAAVPIAGLTALQALRDHAHVEAGQKVLVNGASGGVGTFAVQLAKALGADVTAVCSTRNVEQAEALGADRVVDYTKDDFTRIGIRHDVLLDIAGSRSFLACRRVLEPEGTFVLVGGKMTYRGLGPLGHIAGTFLKSRFRRPAMKFFVTKVNTDDLRVIGGLIEAGKVRPVVERSHPLSDAVEALADFGEGHARGKIVIAV